MQFGLELVCKGQLREQPWTCPREMQPLHRELDESSYGAASSACEKRAAVRSAPEPQAGTRRSSGGVLLRRLKNWNHLSGKPYPPIPSCAVQFGACSPRSIRILVI